MRQRNVPAQWSSYIEQESIVKAEAFATSQARFLGQPLDRGRR